MTSLRTFSRLAGTLLALYAAACALGVGLTIVGFRLGLLSGVGILFYRGLLLALFAAAGTLAILVPLAGRAVPRTLGPRDAVAATLVSLAFNVCFLVVVPVTADRSITIFLLGEMAATPEAVLTPDEASRLFKTVYVDQYRQIERRLDEQTVSGNLETVGGGYRITRRGRFVAAIADLAARLFDSRAGLAAPAGAATATHDAMAARP